MLTTTDRGGQTYGLSPTAEEVVTDYAKAQINSYKQLPVTYFQQATKFRDEIRPRFGLMRVKEFIMMDAYSFHPDTDCLQITYDKMRAAYTAIFRRCGLEAFAVEADSGAIGGSASHEFMVAADVGEDAILIDESAGYAANVERATGIVSAPVPLELPAATVIETPDCGGIDDVVNHLQGDTYPGMTAAHMLKTVLFSVTSGHGMVTKAQPSSPPLFAAIVTLMKINWSSPWLATLMASPNGRGSRRCRCQSRHRRQARLCWLSLKADLQFVDEQTAALTQTWITGANADDQHVVGLALADYPDLIAVDLMTNQAGDQSPRSDQVLSERRGIEVGHIFQLGTKYSAAMGAVFNGQDGKRHPLEMGCYGIGTSRVAAAAVEQCHDDKGIIWPKALAPYHVVIVPAKLKDDAQRSRRGPVYAELKQAGVEVLLDDRDLGPGVKFKDWDLIGIPTTRRLRPRHRRRQPRNHPSPQP